jgi:hypothetical protein
MNERIAEASPRFKARMAGVSYLLTSTAYGVGQMLVLGKLVVHGNAAATANNILAHGHLMRLGFAADIVSVACSIVLTVLFYDLFKPVKQEPLVTRRLLPPGGIGYCGCWQPPSTRSLGRPGRVGSIRACLKWNSCRRWRICFSN